MTPAHPHALPCRPTHSGTAACKSRATWQPCRVIIVRHEVPLLPDATPYLPLPRAPFTAGTTSPTAPAERGFILPSPPSWPCRCRQQLPQPGAQRPCPRAPPGVTSRSRRPAPAPALGRPRLRQQHQPPAVPPSLATPARPALAPAAEMPAPAPPARRRKRRVARSDDRAVQRLPSWW